MDATPFPRSNRRIALLIDADNISHTTVAAIVAETSRYGTANVRRAYGDWANPCMKGWRDKLHEHAIRPIQQFSYSTGKNATDIALVIDAMELLHTQKPDAFCIASSDADFTPLVMHLRSHGHDVHGFGERKTLTPFVNACTTFLYLDGLPDPDVMASPIAITTDNGTAVGNCKLDAAPKQQLAGDTTLVNALRGGVAAAVRNDGWAMLGAAGSATKQLAPIDPRSYGAKNFTALFGATGLFDIVRADNGHPYVADKRNKTRAARPTMV